MRKHVLIFLMHVMRGHGVNGSTTVSKTVGPGSNPGVPAIKKLTPFG